MSKVTRRDAIKLLAGAGASAAATVSCTERARTQEAVPMKPSENTINVVQSMSPLGFQWKTRDPFLFCVHHDDHYPLGNDKLGPAASLAGRDLGQDFAGKDGWRMYHGEVVPGFPQHPHRGFETVTVVRRGLIDHSDSLGAGARYGQGDVQWLTAGKGILHAEMFPLLEKERENPLELFQIWLNLPKANKMVDPVFSMFWSHKIPKQIVRDEAGRTTEITLTAGRYGEVAALPPPPNSWAANAENDVAIWAIKMAPGARWTLPAASAGVNRTLYFFAGSALGVAGQSIPAKHQIDVRPEVALELEAGPDEVEILLLQGRPIDQPIAQYGPFVMNSRAEIEQAFRDFQRTQFGGWPFDRNDPTHPREEGRFARHADGRLERPV